MQTYPLILNASSVVSGSNNSLYRYTFPSGSVKFNDSKVAVANISMFYSWQNITITNANNTFSFTWPGIANVTVTIPNGFYDIPAINAYIQSICVTNGLYLINSAGNFVYYLELVTNANAYAIQFNSYPIPTALPATYSAPGSWPGYPVVATTPQIIVPATNFRNVIGFSAGTYPTVVQATNYSVLSTSTPQVTVVESLLLSCSLLNNRYSNPNTILYSFSAGGNTFGSLIDSSPNQYSFVDIQNGSYSYFDVQFLDQNYNPMIILDNNLVIQLLIENKKNGY